MNNLRGTALGQRSAAHRRVWPTSRPTPSRCVLLRVEPHRGRAMTQARRYAAESRPMTYDDVIAFCRSLPGAWEDTPREGDVVVKAGPKVFVFPGPEAVSLKVHPDAGDELRLAYPDAVGSAPYLSKKHWVRISL